MQLSVGREALHEGLTMILAPSLTKELRAVGASSQLVVPLLLHVLQLLPDELLLLLGHQDLLVDLADGG